MLLSTSSLTCIQDPPTVFLCSKYLESLRRWCRRRCPSIAEQRNVDSTSTAASVVGVLSASHVSVPVHSTIPPPAQSCGDLPALLHLLALFDVRRQA